MFFFFCQTEEAAEVTNSWAYFSTTGSDPTTWADMATAGPDEATWASLET